MSAVNLTYNQTVVKKNPVISRLQLLLSALVGRRVDYVVDNFWGIFRRWSVAKTQPYSFCIFAKIVIQPLVILLVLNSGLTCGKCFICFAIRKDIFCLVFKIRFQIYPVWCCSSLTCHHWFSNNIAPQGLLKHIINKSTKIKIQFSKLIFNFCVKKA